MIHHRVDAVAGLAGWACHGHREWCGPVSSPEYTGMNKKKKTPVNASLQGQESLIRIHAQFRPPVTGLQLQQSYQERCHKIERKSQKIEKEGVPDPPYCCQSLVLSPRSNYMPLMRSSVSSLSSLRERKSRTKHVNTCSYDFRAPATVELRVMGPHYIDRGHLYELNSVKKYYFMWSIC